MIAVLRIGHRPARDKRISTHIALVARAFGAHKVIITAKDKKLEERVCSLCKRFGGNFEIESGISYKKIIEHWTGIVVHLTMYGEELNRVLDKIDKTKDLLVIVGAEKVQSEIYHLTNFNVSVGNQPHSEVAALAVFLDHYTEGRWLKQQFNGKIKIIPTAHGKTVISKDRNREEP